MCMEVTQVLLGAQSPDANIRTQAEATLKQFEEQNLPCFLVSLSVELANNGKPAESRKLAGLILKNSLDGKGLQRKQELAHKWMALDLSVKSQIKLTLMQTLASGGDAAHTAAQVIAKVAGIDIPHNQWPELIALLNNMGSGSSGLKVATLEALGYVCEEVSANVLAQDQVNSILTAVVQGMNANETNAEVRLSATRALNNALDIAHTNFENKVERDYIMRVIYEAAVSADERVRKAAFECLVSIASMHYEKLEAYMQDIFTITSKAVKQDAEQVALQAIEFWSAICDEEIILQGEARAGYSGDSNPPSFQFIRNALPHLVPLLLETMTKQDEDMWNLSMAGGTCLGLAAKAAEDSIVPLVMPFIEQNISKPDWRLREAATYAFGSIIEGPRVQKLKPLVDAALGFLLNALKDENSSVRDTTAWTLGRIFEFLHGSHAEVTVVSEQTLPHILKCLLESLKDIPNVAERSCGALHFLVQGYEDTENENEFTPLNPYYVNLVEDLLAAAEREDRRLKVSAYETLEEVIRCASAETVGVVVQLMPMIMTKLENAIQMQVVSTHDRKKQSELQELLCGVLRVIIQRLGAPSSKHAVLQHGDRMMELFLKVLGCQSATVHEEAMLAIAKRWR